MRSTPMLLPSRRAAFAVALLVPLLGGPGAPPACLGSEKEEFLRRYKTALADLDHYLSQVRARGVLTRVIQVRSPSEPASRKEIRAELSFNAMGKNKKLGTVVESEKQPGGRSRTAAPPYSESSYIMGPDGPFMTARKSKEGKHELRGRGGGPGEAPSGGILENEIKTYFRAPISLDARYLPEIVASPDFTIEGVSEIRQHDRGLIKVKFHHTPKGKPERGVHGWFTVDPALRMALVEFDLAFYVNQYATDTVYRGRVSYAPESHNGYPVPEKVEYIYNNTYKGQRRVEETKTFAFTEFGTDPTPESEFTMAFHGLGDANLPPASHSSPLPYVFAVVGLVSLVLSVLLAWRGCRHKAERAS